MSIGTFIIIVLLLAIHYISKLKATESAVKRERTLAIDGSAANPPLDQNPKPWTEAERVANTLRWFRSEPDKGADLTNLSVKKCRAKHHID
jgi:hypothetical protein